MADRAQLLASLDFLRLLGLKLSDEDEDLVNLYSDGDGVAIVGLLKRGKSTLINSLIGEQISPIGREPETWCSIRVTNGRWKAWAQDSDGVSIPLPADPDAFRDAITRRGGSISMDTKLAMIEFPNRLPLGLRLIDTPGLLESDLEEADLVWRRSGATAAILVTSFPPGVGKEERLVLDKMVAHFGEQNVKIVMKGLDSELTPQGLDSAAEIWTRYGWQAIQVLESRSPSVAEWGSGPFALLESAISELNEVSRRRIEQLAVRVEEILIRGARKSFHDLTGFRGRKKNDTEESGRSNCDLLSELRRAYDLPLIMQVKYLATSAYISEFDPGSLKDLAFDELLDAAHCGVDAACKMVKSAWEQRFLTCGFLEMFDASCVTPSYSRFRALDCVELTYEDLVAFNEDRGLSIDTLRPLQGAVNRFIDRMTKLRELDAALYLPLPEEYQVKVATKLIRLVRNAFETKDLGRLNTASRDVNPRAWQTLAPAATNAVEQESMALLGAIRTRINEVAQSNPVSVRGSYSEPSASFTDVRQIPMSLETVVKTLDFVWSMRKQLSDEALGSIEELRLTTQGHRGLVEWVDHVCTPQSEREQVRKINVRNSISYAVLFTVVFIVLFSFQLWLPGALSLAGAVAFGASAYKRDSEDLPIMIFAFEEFTQVADLDYRSNQHRQIEKRLAAGSAVAILLGLIAVIFSGGARDINRLADSANTEVVIQEGRPTPNVVTSVELRPSFLATSTSIGQSANAVPVDTKVQTTSATAPPPTVLPIDISTKFGNACGRVEVSAPSENGSLEIVPTEGSARTVGLWTQSGIEVLQIECEGSTTILTLRRSATNLVQIDSEVFAGDSITRLSSQLVRIGVNGDRCCFPDVPFGSSEILKLASSGKITREASEIDRYPLWNSSIDYCDRLASEREFVAMEISGESMVGVDAYATVCVEGPLVTRLQEVLVEEGFNVIPDGEFGPRTLRALKGLASSKGIDDVEGVARVDGELFFAKTAGRS